MMAIILKRTMLAACSAAVLAASPALARPAKQISEVKPIGESLANSLHTISSAQFSSGGVSTPGNVRGETRRIGRVARVIRQGRGITALASVAPTAEPSSGFAAAPSFGGSGVIAEARRYLGTNPTSRRRAWCAEFMNLVLARTGRAGTGSALAGSFASYGQRVAGPQVGAIAVIGRGSHVGVVSGVDESGNPIIVSGNHNGTVAEAAYPRGRVSAYVMP
jgi:uncharacterized protein (TIGR02594 family)